MYKNQVLDGYMQRNFHLFARSAFYRANTLAKLELTHFIYSCKKRVKYKELFKKDEDFRSSDRCVFVRTVAFLFMEQILKLTKLPEVQVLNLLDIEIVNIKKRQQRWVARTTYMYNKNYLEMMNL